MMCLLTNNKSMGSPLLVAVRHGDNSTAKKILTNGQFTELDEQGANKDGTPLFIACCKGMVEVVHLLILQGASIESGTSYGARPLHAAVDHNELEVTRLLLQYGAKVNSLTLRGDTPCHYAAYRGYVSLVQALVEAGADVTAINNKSQSPVHLAASRDHVTIAKYLQAVADLAKNKQSPASSCQSLYQRCNSGLREDDVESIDYNSSSGSSSDSINTHSHSGTFNCMCDHETNSSVTSCRIDTSGVLDTSSVTSVHNIYGGHLTQIIKEKQYAKNIDWGNV